MTRAFSRSALPLLAAMLVARRAAGQQPDPRARLHELAAEHEANYPTVVGAANIKQ